jgi:hypothetical protein
MRFTLKDYQSDAVGDVLRSLTDAREAWHRKRRPCRRHEGQLEDGLVALGVPVMDTAATVVATMNVYSYSLRTGPVALPADYLRLLRRTASEIESEIQSATLGAFSAAGQRQRNAVARCWPRSSAAPEVPWP